MWRQLTDAVGAERRDALWFHPDLVPTADDITDPSALIARITSDQPQLDEFDQALEDLLNDESGDRPVEDTPPDSPAPPASPVDDSDR